MVPPELTGVWRRQRLAAPGLDDRTTRVMWLQTRSWYADLRVPAEPTRTGLVSLEACQAPDLAQLARVEGFAGELSFADGVCSWRRDLDFQPAAPSPDEGRIEFRGDLMIEHGVHSRYVEDWRSEPETRGPLLAFASDGDLAGGGRRGLLVVAGDHFLCVIDRPRPLPPDIKLATLVEGRGDRSLLDMPICYGRIGRDGAWTVHLASHPWLEKRPLWAGAAASYDARTQVLHHRGAAAPHAWRLIDASISASDVAGVLKLG